MAQPSRRRILTVLTAAALTVAGLLAAAPTAAAPGHTTVVTDVPSNRSPDIVDGTVFAIHDAGSKIIVGGSFTKVQNRNSDVDIARNRVLAFDKATGAVDTAFAPAVGDQVNAVIAGPTPGTVYLAGKFNTVNGVNQRKVALVNVADGSLVPGFANPAFDGLVTDIALAGSRLLVGGIFTHAGTSARGGLASLNATTGALDSYLTTTLTEHHNYDGSGAQAGVGAEKLALSPDGRQLVVIGNFRKANGALHDQVVKLDLGTTSATVANWNTDRYTPACADWAFDTYMRDVAFAPDSRYFVIVTTGAAFADTLCDTAARWEAGATGTNLQPTWVDYSGGDTFLSVGISEQAVYVGGHLRWLNNSSGRDAAQAGAVGRASIAALDPTTGLPMSWNPGRNPRGYGVAEMLVTPDGIWLGSDTQWIGSYQYRRERIAFFPLAGGAAPHPTTTVGLPGWVYQASPGTGSSNDVTVRSYDGAKAVGQARAVANPDGTAWSTVKGAFWVGGTLFYGKGGTLLRRSFDGTQFGPVVTVDPYHDPYWDTVETGSGPDGQTYAGATVNFYPELANLTGMFFAGGRLYYTLSGQSGLFWRWFTPDSGVVGASRFTVAGATGFADAGAIFLAGGKLYLVGRSTGNLSSITWVNGAPSGSPTLLSGPTVDGVDWRGKAVFLGPQPPDPQPLQTKPRRPGPGDFHPGTPRR